jgi:hypothetical protein
MPTQAGSVTPEHGEVPPQLHNTRSASTAANRYRSLRQLPLAQGGWRDSLSPRWPACTRPRVEEKEILAIPPDDLGALSGPVGAVTS